MSNEGHETSEQAATETPGTQHSALSAQHSVIDTDVHSIVPAVGVLFPYLSDFWKEYMTQSAFRGPTEDPYPKNVPTSIRPDARTDDGMPPGAKLVHVQQGALAGVLGQSG